MITIELLKGKGYPISTLKDQQGIDLAANSVMLAYFPGVTDFDGLDDVVCALTFALLLRRSAVATRFGAVNKQDGYSALIEEQKSLKEARSYALPFYNDYLRKNCDVEGINDFDDIIGLYDRIFL